jgi:hypothetical protein
MRNRKSLAHARISIDSATGELSRRGLSEFVQIEFIDRGPGRSSGSAQSVDLCAEAQILEDGKVCVKGEPL